MRWVMAFIVLLVSICLGFLLKHDPGYVLISFHQWTMETSVLVLLLGLILLYVLGFIVVSLGKWILGFPWKLNRFFIKRAHDKASLATIQGYIQLHEGAWQKAEKNLMSAASQVDTPFLNYMLAATAAFKKGDLPARDSYLDKATKTYPQEKCAIALFLAEMQLEKFEWQAAIHTLEPWQSMAKKRPFIVTLLLRAYVGKEAWAQVVSLFLLAKRQRIFISEESQALLEKAYLEELVQRIKTGEKKPIQQWMEAIPASLKCQPSFAAAYSEVLFQQGDKIGAEKCLRSALKRHLDEKVLNLYVLRTEDTNALKWLESLIPDSPQSSILYLAAARLSLRQHLWGKARQYLEESIQQSPSPEAYYELGELLTQLNEPTRAMRAYQSGLALGVN